MHEHIYIYYMYISTVNVFRKFFTRSGLINDNVSVYSMILNTSNYRLFSNQYSANIVMFDFL